MLLEIVHNLLDFVPLLEQVFEFYSMSMLLVLLAYTSAHTGDCRRTGRDGSDLKSLCVRDEQHDFLTIC